MDAKKRWKYFKLRMKVKWRILKLKLSGHRRIYKLISDQSLQIKRGDIDLAMSFRKKLDDHNKKYLKNKKETSEIIDKIHRAIDKHEKSFAEFEEEIEDVKDRIESINAKTKDILTIKKLKQLSDQLRIEYDGYHNSIVTEVNKLDSIHKVTGRLAFAEERITRLELANKNVAQK